MSSIHRRRALTAVIAMGFLAISGAAARAW